MVVWRKEVHAWKQRCGLKIHKCVHRHNKIQLWSPFGDGSCCSGGDVSSAATGAGVGNGSGGAGDGGAAGDGADEVDSWRRAPRTGGGCGRPGRRRIGWASVGIDECPGAGFRGGTCGDGTYILFL